MGTACKVAIMNTNLPDSVHSVLHEIVSTCVNTLWLDHLKGAPLYLSVTKAERIYMSILQDLQLDS